MAFASVGTFISQNSKVSESSWSTTTEAAVAAGDLLIVVIAADNIHTDDGETADITGVTYDGTPMTKIKEFTNGNAAVDTGAMVAVFALQNAAATSSGAAVVASFGSAVVAKAMRGWKFTMDNAKVLTVEASDTLANDGGDAGSVALLGLVNREHLVFRATASEATLGLVTATSGWTSIYTFGDGGSTSGGAADTNQSSYGEFKIATSTGETSDPTLTVGSIDHASVMAAFFEDSGVTPGGESEMLMRRRRR